MHVHIHSQHAHKFHVYLHEKRVHLREKTQTLFHHTNNSVIPRHGEVYGINGTHPEASAYEDDSIFSYVPPEVLLHIMRYLPFLDLCSLILTNRQLAILATTEDIWKEMFMEKYDTTNQDAYEAPVAFSRSSSSSSSSSLLSLSKTPSSSSLPIITDLGLLGKASPAAALEIRAEAAPTWRSMYANCYRREQNWKGDAISEKLVWGHSAGIWAVKIRGGELVTASADCTVRTWEVHGKKVRNNKILRGHTGVVKCIDYDPSLSRIISGSCDGSIRVWDVSKGKKKCVEVLEGHTNWVRGVQATGNILVSASSDRTLKVWNIDSGECVQTFEGHTNYVRSVQFEDNKLVSGSADGTIRVWDMNTGTATGMFRSPSACAVRDFQFEGSKLVSAFADSTIRIWDLNQTSSLTAAANNASAITGELTGHTLPLWCLRFQGHRLVSGSADRSVKVWDMRKMSCIHTLGGHSLPVWGVDMQDCTIVSGGADRLVKVWDFSG